MADTGRSGLRLMIYDSKQLRIGQHWLSRIWRVGAGLYEMLGRLDGYYGADSWRSALTWLTQVNPSEPIQEIQFWGHGQWGRALIDRDVLSDGNFTGEDPLYDLLVAVRARIAGIDG